MDANANTDKANLEQLKKFVDFSTDCIRCPITHQIFADPVLASDGVIYEREAIERVFSKNNPNSPYTAEPFENKNLVSVYPYLGLRDELLNINPKLKEDLYIAKTHSACKKTIDTIIEKCEFDKLLNYCEFDKKLLSYVQMNKILKNCDSKVALHLIDNLIDLGDIIIYIVYHCESYAVEYIVDIYKTRKLKLNTASSDGRNLVYLHLQNEHRDIDILKLLLDEGCDINKPNNDNGYTPMHIAFKTCPLEFIKFLLKYNPKLDIKDKDGKYAHEYLKENETFWKGLDVQLISTMLSAVTK